jgi:thioredoxin-like negative regulator of GroEL
MARIEIDRTDRKPPPLEPLRQAVASRPDDVAARRRLGWALYGSDEIDEALAVFRQARHDFPDDVDVVYGLALTAKKAGASDESDEAFLMVAERAKGMSDPGRSEILHRLATGHHNRLRTGRWGLVQEVWGGQ